MMSMGICFSICLFHAVLGPVYSPLGTDDYGEGSRVDASGYILEEPEPLKSVRKAIQRQMMRGNTAC